MEKQNVLDLLAQEVGIQPGFFDPKGVFHQVSADTKTALLQAMALLPQGADPESTLADLLAASRGELVPRVLVQNEDSLTHDIPLQLGPDEIGRKIEYYLAADQGESLSGQITDLNPQPENKTEEDNGIPRRFVFSLNQKLQPGYHRLTLHTACREATLKLIVVPTCCFLPEGLKNGRRLWGTDVQLSTLASRTNWGVGDFGDLERLIDCCADTGIDIVGLSPLHRPCTADSETSDRPAPSSRYVVDPLLVDLTRISDYSAERFQNPEFAALLSACRKAQEIDYFQAAKLKRQGFQILYRDFCRYHLETNSERAEAFRIFKAAGGSHLFYHAVFFALQEHFQGQGSGGGDWRDWPEEYRRPDSKAVLRFADQKRNEIDLQYYILWQSEMQLAACGDRSLARHLGIGLCPEIAAGSDPGGAETWIRQPLYSLTATIGAPPESRHPRGIDWGLAPPIPHCLVQTDYEPFISLLRANMRFTGGIQIDNVMQMLRLFWIPKGAEAQDGAYVHYPWQTLLGIVALESVRNKCMVIARGLTTEAEHFDQRLREKNIFTYASLVTGNTDGFHSPMDCPEKTVATVLTPGWVTLAGYWEGLDLDRRSSETAAIPEERLAEIQTLRQTDRDRILATIEEEELLPPGMDVTAGTTPAMTDALNRAIHRILARSPALIVMAALEDIFRLHDSRSPSAIGQAEPMPRLKFSPYLEEVARSSTLADFAAAMTSERSSRPTVHEHRGRLPLQVVIPRATYRLQLKGDFTFAQATELVDYLAELGISHCYTSPCFAARAGSSHGYDVVDPNYFNNEIGGMDDFRAFCQALRDRSMGQIMDIVPNHMGVMGSDNIWWLDVLENGPSSSYARFFDIDWEPAKSELSHKLLIPVLGEPYGKALELGHLILVADPGGGSFSVYYHGHRFPLDPRTYPLILNRRLDILEIKIGPDNPFIIELLSLITAFGQLSPATETDTKKIRIRRRDKEILKDRLASLAEKCADIKNHLLETADEYNIRTPAAAGLRDFHILLEQQNFRLAYWRVAADEINYRRFFDINDLAALCVENDEVFSATHRLIIDLIRQGKVEGLRIDHPDGLFSPARYYRRLCRKMQPERTDDSKIPVYLVAEKILAHHEHLPPDWLIHGTTGYDFSYQVNNLFVDKRSEKRMSRIYRRFTRIADNFDTILYNSKKQIMRLVLASELNVLANRLDKLSERNWQTRDFTLNNLREALSEVAACFPVYRTYVTEDDVSAQDRNSIDWAVSQAKRNSPVSDHTIFDFIRSVLLADPDSGTDHDLRLAAVDFAMRFQQFTAPVMAKSMEDTAFYIYNRLVSLNEVGGDPRRFGISVGAFHRLCRERLERWPHSMLGTSTHDSKRSEDARCRLNVLSEIPDEWNRRLLFWAQINRVHLKQLDNTRAPSANDEYLIYQSLLAIWPGDGTGPTELESLQSRLGAYMQKACREAKVHSSWAEPNLPYEEAVKGFIDVLLAKENSPFLADFLPFQQMIARLGLYNGLSQCLLKLTVPGIPDIYQGCELWDFHLVDPDNRQPVDYGLRQHLLTGLKRRHSGKNDLDLAAELLNTIEDSRLKLYVTWRLLSFRRQHEDLFRQGAYIPLTAIGKKTEHLCGFARRLGKNLVVSVCARFFSTLTKQGGDLPCGPVWAASFLRAPAGASGRWRDILTGNPVRVQKIGDREVFSMEEVFVALPVAVLEYID